MFHKHNPRFLFSSVYTLIKHHIIRTCLILCRSLFCCHTALRYLAMGSTRPLKVSVGVCLSSTSHRCLLGLRFGEFRDQVNTVIHQTRQWSDPLILGVS